MRILISFLLLFSATTIKAQTDINSEEFKSDFSHTKEGGQLTFDGKSHAFQISLKSTSIKETGNPNFFIINNLIFQANILPIPATIDLSKISIKQEKQILESYVQYELEYFKSDLKLKISDLSKEWRTIGSKLFLVWKFNVPNINLSNSMKDQVKSQIYLSTICFNQILDLNTPIMDISEYSKSEKMLYETAKTLKLYSK